MAQRLDILKVGVGFLSTPNKEDIGKELWHHWRDSMAPFRPGPCPCMHITFHSLAKGSTTQCEKTIWVYLTRKNTHRKWNSTNQSVPETLDTRGSVVRIQSFSNCWSENLLTESFALSRIFALVSSFVLVITWAMAAAYSLSWTAKNPFLQLTSSTMMSIKGPPDLWAMVINPEASISTTAENRNHATSSVHFTK